MQQLYRLFGARVRAARSRASLTQLDLASRIGLTRTSITNIERGTQHIPLHLLYAISAAVGVEPTELLPPTTALDEAALRLPKGWNAGLSPAEDDWVRRL